MTQPSRPGNPSSTTGALRELTPGMVIPFGGNRYTTVTAELAAAFQPGDHLHVVQSTGALLHVPAAVRAAVDEQIAAAADAAAALATVTDGQIATFYARFAEALADDTVWGRIVDANTADIARAQNLGRSTTRLAVWDTMRSDMVAGLTGWAQRVRDGAGRAREVGRVDHGNWSVQVVTAPLGVIGFVFEGRPNVFADAAGVLATGNAAVLRIGSDALATAQAIDTNALRPALEDAGLPSGAIALIPVRDRAAGWALFSDSRLALAVARGSGEAVTQLGSVARQSGIPLSAHGTGGAWLIADDTASRDRLAHVVENSLDRKVCNTLNVAAVTRARAAELIPVIIAAADRAASARDTTARLHVTTSARPFVNEVQFARNIDVHRAEGTVPEPRATLLADADLGIEWEWEGTPELTITVIDDLDHGITVFNEHSPQFVVSLVSEAPDAHARLRERANAPFVGDGFTRWVDGQYALNQPELGLSNWENGRLLARGGVLTGADLTTRRTFATTPDHTQHR